MKKFLKTLLSLTCVLSMLAVVGCDKGTETASSSSPESTSSSSSPAGGNEGGGNEGGGNQGGGNQGGGNVGGGNEGGGHMTGVEVTESVWQSQLAASNFGHYSAYTYQRSVSYNSISEIYYTQQGSNAFAEMYFEGVYGGCMLAYETDGTVVYYEMGANEEEYAVDVDGEAEFNLNNLNESFAVYMSLLSEEFSNAVYNSEYGVYMVTFENKSFTAAGMNYTLNSGDFVIMFVDGVLYAANAEMEISINLGGSIQVTECEFELMMNEGTVLPPDQKPTVGDKGDSNVGVGGGGNEGGGNVGGGNEGGGDESLIPSGDPTYMGQTGAEMYAALNEYLLNNGKNLTANIHYDVNSTSDYQGTEIALLTKMDVISKVNGDAEYAKMTMNVFMPEYSTEESMMTTVSEVTYTGTTLYVHSDDGETSRKVKLDMTPEQYKNYTGVTEETENTLQEISAEALANAAFNVSGDEVTLTVIVSGDEAARLSQEMLSSTANGVTAEDITISKITYVVYMTLEGELKYVDIDFTASMTIMNEMLGAPLPTVYVYDGRTTYSNLGTTEVSAPADASSYLSGTFA